MKNSLSNIVKNKGVGLLVGICVYAILGVFLNTLNVRLYDEFPENFYVNPRDSSVKLIILVSNDAPLTLPLVTSLFTIGVRIEDSSRTYAFFTGHGFQPVNFTESNVKIGVIKPGESATHSFILVLFEEDVQFTVDVFLLFVNQIKCKSYTYALQYKGDNEYTITRMN